MERGHNGRTLRPAFGEGIRNVRARQRALCIAADGGDAYLAELRELLRTAGVAIAGELVQRRDRPDPNHYLGKGKLGELRLAISQSGANLVATDDELSARQERNLEQAVGVPVIDRTAIILDIFADHAHSAEGKLQVELAQLEYNLSRMRGLWTHLERLGGGIGTRGPGETQIETDRRLARDRVAQIKRRLDRLAQNRRLQRAERERASLPTVALAGYTNAGKSTLLNALTGATAGVGERLFHTLDPTTRALAISGRTYLMTDTVGFIRKLPHQLVEAFAATLEEAMQADLIVHVADAAAGADELEEMLAAVDAVLAGASAPEHQRRLLCLNKADLLDGDRRRELEFRHRGAIQVSAQTGEGLSQLSQAIEAHFFRWLRPMHLFVPHVEQSKLSELHDVAGELDRTDTPEGVHIRARVPAGIAPRFERFEVNGNSGEDLER